MTIQVVGVIGAGIIGTGLAQNLAQTGHHVILIDTSESILDYSCTEIRQNLRLQRLLRSAPLEDTTTILNRITCSIDYESCAAADLVIENVPEKWEIKQEVFARLDAVCNTACILSTNTSAISVTRLAALTKRPGQVLGTHFMNPVPLKTFVEVVRGYQCTDETIERATGLLTQMGKQWTIVHDSPGFVSNRVLMLTINEAIFLVQEQVASIEQIDLLFRQGFDHKMGPLETADIIGLDTILYTIEILYENFPTDKYLPCPLLRRMVEDGLLGRKCGKGFYNYV